MFLIVVVADEILLLTTLLAIDLIPRPVPPTVSREVLRLCLAGLGEDRSLRTLASLRSLGVSKILKSELLSLQTQMSKSKVSPEVLTSRHLALNILVDLRVSDIRPLCAFLGDCNEIDRWTTLDAIAGSLEKSTQGRVVTGLKEHDIEVFNPILQQGLSEFESDGMIPFYLLIDQSHVAKGYTEFPSRLYQSYQLQRRNLRVSKYRQ